MKKVLNVLLSLMLLCVNILTPFVDVVKGDEVNPIILEEGDIVADVDGDIEDKTELVDSDDEEEKNEEPENADDTDGIDDVEMGDEMGAEDDNSENDEVAEGNDESDGKDDVDDTESAEDEGDISDEVHDAADMDDRVIQENFTVEFYNRGTLLESLDAVGGEVIEQPEDPEMSGYTFAGWYTEAGTKWNFMEDVVEGNMSLQAYWKITITYHPSEGAFKTKSENEPIDVVYSPNDSGIFIPDVNIQFPDREGYMFDGWYTDTDVEWIGSVDSGTQKQDVYAKWLEFEPLNLSFGGVDFTIMDRNLGATSDVSTESYGKYYQWGNNYGFPRNGMIQQTSANAIDLGGYGPGNYFISSSFILNRNDTSINKNLWGGMSDLDNDRQGPCPIGYHVPDALEWEAAYDIYKKDNPTATFSTFEKNLNLSRPGHFNGYVGSFESGKSGYRSSIWSAKNNAYQNLSTSSNIKYSTVASDGYSVRCFKNYYEQDLIYELNGGINSENNPDKTAKWWSDNAQSLEDPSYSKHKFLGWYTNPEFDPESRVVNNILGYEDEPVTLYANWEESDYELSFYDEESKKIHSSIQANSGDMIILPYANNGEKRVERWFDGNDYYLPGTQYLVNSDAIFYAELGELPTITYHPNEGAFKRKEINETIDVEYTMIDGKYIPNLHIQIPDRVGYMFDGWYTDTTYTEEWIGLVDDSTQTQTVYAKWLVYEPLNFSFGGIDFTIMDRNLGARSNDPLDETSRGKYYQWGNIYGFNGTGEFLPNVSQYGVDASDYGPGNYYYSSIFLGVQSWETSINKNLWGSLSAQNPDEDKQGPCPIGYHVPDYHEWGVLYDAWTSIYSTGKKADFVSMFKLPQTGWISPDDGKVEDSSDMNYWSSSRHDINNASIMYWGSGPNSDKRVNISDGLSIRCFRNYEKQDINYVLDEDVINSENNPTETVKWWDRDGLTYLKNPVREGYDFLGWYTDSEFASGTKITTNAITSDETVNLYAKWKESESSDKLFPKLFEYTGSYVFDGTNPIDTQVQLYSEQNWQKDYEIGFRIDSFSHVGQVSQAVFVNAKLEDSAKSYPGLVFRMAGNDLEITQTINKVKAAYKISPEYPLDVKIVKIDNIVYYSINGEDLVELQDISNFQVSRDAHNVPTSFGAARDPKNGGKWFRPIKGTMSNMYVKMGTYTYNVTWKYKDSNGEDVSVVEEVANHSVPARGNPEIYFKDGYVYVFDGWQKDGEVVNLDDEEITSDVTYEAKYQAIPDKFTVRWENRDGTELEIDENLVYGELPHYDGNEPIRDSDQQYTYTFTGWTDGEHEYGKEDILPEISINVTYTAIYSSTLNEYIIKFENDDGTQLQLSNLVYGTTPVYEGEMPTKASTSQYTYTFTGWTDGEHDYGKEDILPDVTDNTVYTAVYSSTANEYTIKFVDEDGTLLQSSSVVYGEKPEYNGETPTKESDAQYDYTFAGWTPEVVPVTGEATYTATYTSTVRKYEVVWDVAGVETMEIYEYGQRPVYKGSTDKMPDVQYTYTFTGWTDGEHDYGKHDLLPDVVGDVTYTARYQETVRTYTIIWANWNGEELEADENVPYGEMPEYNGETPTKPKDPQNTYTFIGWSPEIKEVDGDLTYVAVYQASVNTYTVVWENENGEELEVDENVPYGEMPEYNGETPTKESDAQYDYIFAGWTPSIGPVIGFVTYTATYTSVTRKYTVTWNNSDGTPIKIDTGVEFGVTPQYEGATPTSGGDVQYTYNFAGWSPIPGPIGGNTTYTAVYTWEKNKYTVKWKNYDGEILETDNVEYGTIPEYNGETPGKPRTPQYSYTFIGWDPEIATVIGNAEYTAQFVANINNYDVSFVNYDGTVLKVAKKYPYGTSWENIEKPTVVPTRPADAQYTYEFLGWTPEILEVTGEIIFTATYTPTLRTYNVTWKNYDGEVLETDYEVPYGSDPEYNGDTPERPGTPQYSYVFAGWSPDVEPVTGEAVYTATFTEQQNTYTVTWKNRDGTGLEVDENVPYGTTPEYNGDKPTKESDVQYDYEFQGWNQPLSPVTSNITYIAQFSPELRTYTVTWKNYDGEVLETDYEVPYGSDPEYNGDTPEKPGTPQYSYIFDKWSPTIDKVGGDTVYTATYKEVINKYKVTWENDDGTVLDEDDEVEYGTTPQYHGETPSKTGDAQYSYDFNGWDKEITEIYEDTTYMATYVQSINEYDITWVDGDGHTLKVDSVPYGEIPAYDGETPTKTATAQYTYTFNNKWLPEITSVEGSTVYLAQFDSKVNQYDITATSSNVNKGTVSGGGKYDYGTIIELVAEALQGYKFGEWTENGIQISTNPTLGIVVEGTRDIIAQFLARNDTPYIVQHRKQNVEDNEYTEAVSDRQILTGITDEQTNAEAKNYEGFTSQTFDQGTISPAGNTIVSIFYTRNFYHLLIRDGDEVLVDKNIKFEAEIPLPEISERPGYTFKGWKNLPENGKMLATGLDIESIWKINKHKIIFDTNGGDGIDPIEVEYNSSLDGIQLPVPTRGGYRFVRWEPELPEVMPDDDIIIEAVWESDGSDKRYSGGGGRKNRQEEKQGQKQEEKQQESKGKEHMAGGEEGKEIEKVDAEVLSVYEWAKKYSITTKETLVDANPDGYVRRGHFAKMMVNYVENVQGKENPYDIPYHCLYWNDDLEEWESAEIREYATKACALGIMGIGMKNNQFRPKDIVSRAEVGTVLSRVLRGDKYNQKPSSHFYEEHLKALKQNRIMMQIANPTERQERRKWLWIMFKRMYDLYEGF